MPLRCVDPTGKSIHSFDLSEDEWQALVLENRKAHHLRMPCCHSSVVLKRSRLGTRFFAHVKRGVCATGEESEVHRQLKNMVVEAVHSQGWTAKTEVIELTPDGEQWRADVLAQKGNARVAVEIQWSGQTNDETLRRQERYKQCGIRGLWLLHQPGFPVAHSLPAVCIRGNLHDGFMALIPHYWARNNARDRTDHRKWNQVIPLREFLDATFGGRFRFGVPLNIEAVVAMLGAEMTCWSCGAETRIVTGIHVAFGPHDCRFAIPDLDEHPELLRIVLKHVPLNLNIGKIKRRFSNTQQRAYVSNGCIHCDSIVGQFFEDGVYDVEEPLCHFTVTLSEQWRHAIVNHHEGAEPGWGVYSPVSRP
jgi:competence protein CoiA-like protein